MSAHATCRPATIALLVAIAASLTCALVGAGPALAAAGEGCPNEQVRAESNVNPATGRAYSQGLPECRSYEMVSPVEKGGSSVQGDLGLPAAPDGNAVGFTSQNAFGDAEDYVIGGLGTAENPYVARRGPSGWATSSVVPPASISGRLSSSHGLAGDASLDLSRFANCGSQVATNELGGVNVVCALGEAPGSWLATPVFPSTTGSLYDGGSGGSTAEYEGSSSDLSNVVFQSTGGAELGAALLPADTSTQNGDGLYEVAGLGRAAPQLRLVNVDDGGSEIGPAMGTRIGGIGSETGQPIACEVLGGEPYASSSYHAISADGQTIYFTACPGNLLGGANEIYARVGGTSTVAISSPSPAQCTTCGSTPASAAFAGASADGSKAFFLTTQQLVNGDTDTTMDLYEYDFDNPQGTNVVQLSAGGPGDLTPGSGAEVQGVLRVSSDGSHLYFVARGVLTTIPNGAGEVAQQGADNLYAVDTTTDETKFVAELCSNATASGLVGDPQCPASLDGAPRGVNDAALWGVDEGREAQTTPDGRYLLFTSYARLLTADPEADADEAQDVYRYDFETGELIRISIGEPSFGASRNGNTAGMDATIATLPAGGFLGGDGALASIDDYGRAISADGSTIVFSTPGSLQAGDTNTGANPSCKKRNRSGGEAETTGCDVYEWHECAHGACADGMAGEVGLISPGTDPTSADTSYGQTSISESGADIFFFTRAELVGQDSDQLIDVYDARVGGGFPAPTSESSCSGAACEGAESPAPVFSVPGTVGFAGSGNQAATPLELGETATAAGVVKITAHSDRALSVSAPGAGTLTLSGDGIATRKRSAPRAGSYVLALILTGDRRKLLAQRKRVTLTVRVTFTPASGKASSATATVTIGQATRRARSKRKG